MTDLMNYLHTEVSSAWAYFLAFGILGVWWVLERVNKRK